MPETWSAEAEPLETVVVGIAQGYATDRVDCELATYGLGSCVAVTLYDQRRLTGAMAHMMLPDSSRAGKGDLAGPFAFVDVGLKLLLSQAERLGSDASSLEAWIVGGASMYSHGAPETVGVRNTVAARQVLAQAGVRIVGEKTGGNAPRQVRLSLATGELRVRSA